MKKRNCWEVKECGREPGGKKVHEFGICPATEEQRLDTIHGGTNAGRACWVVAGTMCKGQVQGTFAQKFSNCQMCNFYTQVKEEEFPKFQLTAILKNKLN